MPKQSVLFFDDEAINTRNLILRNIFNIHKLWHFFHDKQGDEVIQTPQYISSISGNKYVGSRKKVSKKSHFLEKNILTGEWLLGRCM